MAVRREAIQGFYRDLLGREGSEGEVSGWENAPDENAVRQMFLSSPEYTSQHGGNAGWQDVGGVITPTPQPNAPAPTDTPYQITGIGGPTTAVAENPWHAPFLPGNPDDLVWNPPAATTPTSAQKAVDDFYKRHLGRSASADEQSKWLSGAFGWGDANNLSGIERGISTSEEAARRRAATPGTSYSSTPYTGFATGGNDYSAFNTARQQDPGKSAKDAFAMISNTAPPPPFQDREAMGRWFSQYIRPGMDALGHKVLSVDGDGFVYTNHEGTFRVDFAQNAGAPAGSMLQRLQWGATPADAATAARYATGTSGTSGGGTGSGTGASSGGSRRTGAGSTVGDLRSLYQSLGQQYGGPGGPGITNGPLQQVGQDDLSWLITGGLADFIGNQGSTRFGNDVQERLLGVLDRGGALDPSQVARRYESARELLDKGRRTMVNDLRGDLANRNLLSEPGIPQGAEISGLNRITERLAPEFSRALRDIYTDESAKSDARMLTSLQLATNMSSDQARNFLAGIGEGTARQTALSDLALRSLQTNMAWSQFLAQFGLERDKVMYEMQNGNLEQMLPLLQAFLQLGGMANNGYV